MQTFRYGPAASQAGDLHLPDRNDAPVVCLFHGGFWRMPYGRDQMTPLAEDLARRGYAAWNLEYRRLGEAGGGWPGSFEDAHAGIEHLAQLRADGAGIDLSRVMTVGHSAGGHLALWAAGPRRIAASSALPQVRIMAAVGQAPAADLKRVHELGCSNGVAQELLGGTPSEVSERYALASPRELLPLGVPQLVVHGEKDDVVPAAVGRDYAKAGEKAGDTVEYIELPGVGHFEHLDPKGEAWGKVVEWLERLSK
ncbi:MAG TPA: alpha/beta hydrolase [Gammaproteobacteria bacterium]|jgi:acetyl esterase/lipase|nr:alpha/beta hydrolase [Gammaproteobacteria bacterium]